MSQFGFPVNFDQNEAQNLVLHKAATAALDAALTAVAQIGYDTTALRAKLFDGTTVRRLLQDNDMDPDQALGGAGASDLKLATQRAIKLYVDSVSQGGLTPIQDFDAANATQFPSGATLRDRYRVSSAGTVLGQVLQVGDMLTARQSAPDPANAAHWIVMQGNADAATNTVLGLVMLATVAEIQSNLAANHNKAVTVKAFNDFEAQFPRLKHFSVTQNLPVGVTGISHNLNSTNIVVQMRTSAGQLMTRWTVTNANAIAVQVSKAYTDVTINVVAR